MAAPRSFPRLPATGGVRLHSARDQPTAGGHHRDEHTNGGVNERISSDRPLSATGRVTQGLAAYRIIKSIGRGKFGVCQVSRTNRHHVCTASL
jgi:hypothetical protein